MNLNPLRLLRSRQPDDAEVPDVRAEATLDELSELFRVFAGLYSTSAGISVTSDSAVASVAVLACLIVRAETLMLMPGDVFRRDGQMRHRLDDHPVARLLTQEWNPLLGAEDGWRWKQNVEDLKGNAYARIEWWRGRPEALWPLTGTKPQLVSGTRPDGRMQLVYRYAGDDFTKADDYPAEEILHFKGPILSRTPYEARSLVELTAENIGLGIATEQFFARFLGNGNHFPLYLQTDETLDTKDITALREQMKGSAGIFETGSTRVFDRGLKVMSREMSLKDADLSQHQRWILEQVCRTWRVPLPMVQDLTHGTYTNSEQADLWLSKYTATPIARNTEGVVRRRLFLPSEQRDHYVKFNVTALQRGDFATRAAGYSQLINCSVMSPNEARALEDWNPYEGGDTYRAPVNLADASEPAQRDGEASALAPLLTDASERVRARAVQDRERGRDTADTVAFGERVYGPIVETAAALGIHLDADVLIGHAMKEA